MLLAALYSHRFATLGVVSGPLVIYGLVKEFYVDVRYESNEDYASGALGAHAIGSW